MDARELLAQVRQRPALFCLDGSFGNAVAFLLGYDAGMDWGLLAGFQEWLARRLDCGNNLAWPALVLRGAFPDDPAGWRQDALDPKYERAATQALWEFVDEFLRTTPSRDEP
jgi:hypothetical protein